MTMKLIKDILPEIFADLDLEAHLEIIRERPTSMTNRVTEYEVWAQRAMKRIRELEQKEKDDGR